MIRGEFPPTADEVAIAIVTACKEVGSDPLDLIPGIEPRDADHQSMITRPRVYAAMALSIVTGWPDSRLSRMVGGGRNSDALLSAYRGHIRKNSIKWFNTGILARVVTSLEKHREIEKVVEAERSVREEVMRPPTFRDNPDVVIAPKVPLQNQKSPMRANFATLPVGNPSYAPGKRALYDELRKAVENTAKLPSQNGD